MGSLVFNQIKLVGFKSFVDPTDFLIEPGLTGIVGPNGCGKSNLLEAIRWVMGANSAKAMRAKGMDDVIFNGTKMRPPRNQAHVTLNIDNRARIAPSIFNDTDDLEVTRIITKGQGSKYKVNGKTVRAKDIQLLFADASTGANSPALVRQGQINELIGAKPSNRRRILEEAAGISGLHTRRHEAELRLRAAETNLDRLEDVVQQIESQLASLRRQSRQAARYKRLAGEIHEFKALLWLKRWQSALEILSASEAALKASETDVQDLAAKAAELTRKATELAETLEPKREEQLIAAAVLARLNAAKETLEQDEASAKTEIRKLEGQIEQLGVDIEREMAIAEDAKSAKTRLDSEFEALSNAKDMTAAISEAQTIAASAIEARTTLENEFNELTRKIADQTARKEGLERDVANAKVRLERLQSEKRQTEQKLNDTRASAPASNNNLFDVSAKDARNALEAARVKERELQAERSELEDKENQHRETLSSHRQALTKIQSEQSTLTKLFARDTDDGLTSALNAIDVQKGYEQALAAALGDDLDAPISGSAPLKWGGADKPSQALPDNIRPLSEFVTAPAELTARLSQIGVANSVDIPNLKSKLLPGQRLVTQDGQLLRWDGFEMDAGAETPAAIRLQQQNRLAEIETEVGSLLQSVENSQADFDQAKASRQALVQALREFRTTLPDLEHKERDAQSALSKFETDVVRREAETQALTDRLHRLDNEISDNQQTLDAAEKISAEFEGAEHLVEQGQLLENNLRDAREAADDASAHYRSLKNESDARKARLNAVETERANWVKRGQLAEERLESLTQRLQISEETLRASTSGPDQFEERRSALFSELEAAEARRNAAADGLAEAETALRNAESDAKHAENKHASAREERAATEARLTAAKERIEDVKARIVETLSCEPGGLAGLLGELPADSNLTETDIERKLERLQNERERMGGVNLRADVEAQEQEERLEAMTSEREDLIAAIARLREGIDELNSEGRERLLQAFETVNDHFGKLFRTLFGGGEASLALTESDDPLEAGLEIMVSPPGKKLGSMSLMSGGEQALTATALIFAVFLSNPAPICVLDEVDAPLDDANVSRYCDLLDEMTRQTNTKFIAITHNAVTMSRMNRLFGVTMAEQGVSQLVSMELNTATQLVAAE